MKPTAEDLRRRLVNSTPSGQPRKQAIALAHDAVAYALEIEERLRALAERIEICRRGHCCHAESVDCIRDIGDDAAAAAPPRQAPPVRTLTPTR